MQTNTAYIGVVGPENEIGVCRDSIAQIIRRSGDAEPVYIRATKGYEARQMHLNNWLEKTHHDWLLLLDHDMVFPSDTLERLRAWQQPFVSGYYLRRSYQPIAPVWLAPQRSGFPFIPWTDDPERGRLHELGASGWGCMLVHREVVLATRPLLKGEPEIIEDDMDVYPYDLPAVLGAMKGLRELAGSSGLSASAIKSLLDSYTQTLEQEIRPLRVDKQGIIGSDIRYPWFARQAGYKLYGDPDVRCGHVINYALHPDDYSRTTDEYRADLSKSVAGGVRAERKRLKELRQEVGA